MKTPTPEAPLREHLDPMVRPGDAEPPPEIAPFDEAFYVQHNGSPPAWTRWQNETAVELRVVLHHPLRGGPRMPNENSFGRDGAHLQQSDPRDHTCVVTWKPGECRRLPSVYDAAIQIVRNGVVVGGECPLLRSLDHKPVLLADEIAKGTEHLFVQGSAPRTSRVTPEPNEASK
jgi:hypothetical protein